MGAAFALALLALAQPAGTLTQEQVRTMPPEELTRRLFGDLGRVMFPWPVYEDRPYGGRRRLALGALSFLTRPYRTRLAGVCQTDMFVVVFERAFGALGDDPAMQPARVQMLTNSFFVSDLAQARSGEMTDNVPPSRGCTEIDPRTVTLIVANSPGQVVGAVQRFADLLDGARAGHVAAALDCQDPYGAPLTEAACLAMLARYRAERIHLIGGAPGCGGAAAGTWCEAIETSLDDITPHMAIVFETPRADRPGIPPSRIRIAPVPPDHSHEVE